jgi:hypothetical protein
MDVPDITVTYSPRGEAFVEDRFEIVLPADDESGASPTLTVIVTPEGILMDAYTQEPDEHRGTIGMTFDEWWEFIVNGRFSGV